MSGKQKVLFLIGFSIVSTTLLFLLVEGVSSAAFAVYPAFKKKPITAEPLYTEYDEELGWINLPNVSIEDLYGPDKDYRTNQQRFRNDQAFDKEVPADKVRMLCSGDSFTLGYGVSNEETWSYKLVSVAEQFGHALETVNMGQGGYGVDQAYLWYRRDGVPLDHDVHIFSFITPDFERMMSHHFLNYGKPVLALEGDQLVPKNVPVPRPSGLKTFFFQGVQAANQLSSVRILKRMLFSTENPPPKSSPMINLPAEDLALEIFRDLLEINRSKNSTLVLVHLPLEEDYIQTHSNEWRHFLKKAAATYDFHFIDMTEIMRTLPPDEIKPLFLQQGPNVYHWAAGHYTAEGNEYVARVLYQELMKIPNIADRLTRN